MVLIVLVTKRYSAMLAAKLSKQDFRIIKDNIHFENFFYKLKVYIDMAICEPEKLSL